MYKEEEQDIYYLHKLLIGLLFDNIYDSYKNLDWIYDIDVLEVLRSLIIEFVDHNCFAPHIKDNIYDILTEGRNKKDENYEKRIELINEIIMILNNQKEDLSVNFYLGELVSRRKNIKEIKKYTLDDLSEEIPYIDESIYNDFIVLFSHGNEVSDGEFLMEYLPGFIDNSYYYESLNMVLEECPSLFKNKLFASRVNLVLNEMKKIDKTFTKTHSTVLKKVKKYR